VLGCLQYFGDLKLQDLLALLTATPFIVWLVLLAYSMKLIFGEEEEKTKGLIIFGSIMIAGAAMILAKPIAFLKQPQQLFGFPSQDS